MGSDTNMPMAGGVMATASRISYPLSPRAVDCARPAVRPGLIAGWLARQQRSDGWWRACGPETTWLSVELLGWLRRASLPFAQRFTWPHLAVTNRDRRTGLPFYGYFADLERLFEAVPGLADAPIDVAFIDLAGFGTFNNAFGMAKGDEVLRSFAQALTHIPESMAIRDGGDEFIVLCTPTGTGLAARMVAFRQLAADIASSYGRRRTPSPDAVTSGG